MTIKGQNILTPLPNATLEHNLEVKKQQSYLMWGNQILSIVSAHFLAWKMNCPHENFSAEMFQYPTLLLLYFFLCIKTK